MSERNYLYVRKWEVGDLQAVRVSVSSRCGDRNCENQRGTLSSGKSHVKLPALIKWFCFSAIIRTYCFYYGLPAPKVLALNKASASFQGTYVRGSGPSQSDAREHVNDVDLAVRIDIRQ